MTHYEILGLSGLATTDDIKAAYERQVNAHLSQSTAESQQFIAQLKAAYAVLSDPARRAQYDQQLYGTPPQAVTVEFVVEEDPAEVYKREYLERKQREKREEHQRTERLRQRMFRILRVVNFTILVVAVVMVIDYFLPSRVYQESVIHSWQERRGGGRHTYYANMLQTAHFTMRVPSPVYVNHYKIDQSRQLTVLQSPILRILRVVSNVDGKKIIVNLPDTLYYFSLTKPFILLGITIGVLLIRRYDFWTYHFCYAPAFVLIFILLVI